MQMVIRHAQTNNEDRSVDSEEYNAFAAPVRSIERLMVREDFDFWLREAVRVH